MPARETLLLHPQRPLRLDAARHAELHVESGTVWITDGGAAGDMFLSAGASYRVPREGRAVVEAVRGVAGVRLSASCPGALAMLADFCRRSLPKGMTTS